MSLHESMLISPHQPQSLGLRVKVFLITSEEPEMRLQNALPGSQTNLIPQNARGNILTAHIFNSCRGPRTHGIDALHAEAIGK